MANHRELARELYSSSPRGASPSDPPAAPVGSPPPISSRSSSKIWRTVVFAGAMLGAPTLASGDPPPPQAPPAQAAAKPAPPKPEGPADKAKRIETLDTERKALYAKLTVVEIAELDKVKREIAAKDAAIKKLVDQIMNMRKPRPRTPPEARPIGRGFVLA